MQSEKLWGVGREWENYAESSHLSIEPLLRSTSLQGSRGEENLMILKLRKTICTSYSNYIPNSLGQDQCMDQ